MLLVEPVSVHLASTSRRRFLRLLRQPTLGCSCGRDRAGVIYVTFSWFLTRTLIRVDASSFRQADQAGEARSSSNAHTAFGRHSNCFPSGRPSSRRTNDAASCRRWLGTRMNPNVSASLTSPDIGRASGPGGSHTASVARRPVS